MREEMGALVGQAWASHALNLLDGTGASSAVIIVVVVIVVVVIVTWTKAEMENHPGLYRVNL